MKISLLQANFYNNKSIQNLNFSAKQNIQPNKKEEPSAASISEKGATLYLLAEMLKDSGDKLYQYYATMFDSQEANKTFKNGKMIIVFGINDKAKTMRITEFNERSRITSVINVTQFLNNKTVVISHEHIGYDDKIEYLFADGKLLEIRQPLPNGKANVFDFDDDGRCTIITNGFDARYPVEVYDERFIYTNKKLEFAELRKDRDLPLDILDQEYEEYIF